MSLEEKIKISFIIPYPLGIAPGQRFRFEHYLDQLYPAGIKYDVYPFYDAALLAILYKKGMYSSKIIGLIRCFIRRVSHVWKSRNSDYIFLFREAFPIGPPVFEWILTKILKRKVIYDFDDAIWLSDPNETRFMSAVKCKGKVKHICRWSEAVVTGNKFLQAYSLKYNRQTVVIPTVVESEFYHKPDPKTSDSGMTIGWTGSHSTLIYLEIIRPVLDRLACTYPIRFLVIADKPPDWQAPYMVFREWCREREISDLQEIDIGIMPLSETEWSRGKCGFKLIQYFSLGIPSVASPVGVNSELIEDGWNGFLCKDSHSWYEALDKLLRSPDLRKQFGKRGRETVKNNYSVKTTLRPFLNLFSSS